jgi:tetratricopeptide (TPR) repeat protein
MNCPQCGTANANEADTCSSCGRDLVADAATMSPTSSGESQHHIGEWRRRNRESHLLPSGFEIGQRYRVTGFLGRGGMGAVYRVWDSELERDVALKLISTELDHDPRVLERFKREIQTSSVVTHRNVLRVYDLGETEGVKFLTMQFVDGDDLAALLRKAGPLPVERAVNIFRQVCLGLAAAHEQGVVHRDLKPQNIMIGKDDHVYLTDFGLAKSSDHAGLTASGAIFGTPDFMSPEQVKGQKVDVRSDIYALGVLFFELLTNKLPFHGHTTYEVMIQRVEHDAPHARTVNPQVPERISKIIDRCLARNPDDRYQSVHEMVADLGGDAAAGPRPALFRDRKILVGAGAAAVLLLILGGLAALRSINRASGGESAASERKPISVLIADVENQTGDPIFDETLEPILSIGLEGSPFITAYNRGQARKTADQLRPGTHTLDEAVARLVGLRDGVQVIITGSLLREPKAFRLVTRAIDTASGNELGRADQTAPDREAVLKVTGTVAQKLRIVLGDAPTEELSEETFTSASLPAAQKYAAAQELVWAGKYEDAVVNYAESAKLDPTMGRAYAGMAATYANLGDREQAEKNYKLAMQHLDRMTDREKYRTRGGYYLLIRNHEKAIEEYRELARQFPADTAALNNLALSYFYRREMKRAMEEQQKPIAIYPNNVLYRNNLALYAMYAGDFAAATREAEQVLKLNPSFVKAYVALALSRLGADQPDEAEAMYRRLEAVSPRGASLGAAGLGDLALFRGDTARAITVLQSGIAADEKNSNKSGAARKRTMLAEALCARGSLKEGIREARAAAELREDADVSYAAARVLSMCKAFPESESIAGNLETRLEPEPQLYAKLIRGENLLLQRRPREALVPLSDAQKIADSWIGRVLRGRAYIELGAFTEASSELDAASKRVGEGVAVLLDDVPTARYLPLLHYDLARAQQGLGSPAARASYEKFLRSRSAAENDPLVADARQRLSTL